MPEHAEQGMVGQDGKPWPQTMDASIWARAWIQHYEANPAIAGDEGTMLGWFANAIMAGYDEAQRREGGAA